MICALSTDARVILGDRHDNTPDLHAVCAEDARLLVTSRYGHYPHHDSGVEVRRIFHTLRSVTIENFNEQFKGMFDGHGQVPTKGLTNTRRFALGAILVYQLVVWYRFEYGADLRVGVKACLKAAWS